MRIRIHTYQIITNPQQWFLPLATKILPGRNITGWLWPRRCTLPQWPWRGRAPNCTRVAASRIQIVPAWPPVACKLRSILVALHATGGHASTICCHLETIWMRLIASCMQFLPVFESTLLEQLFELKNEETTKKSENLCDIYVYLLGVGPIHRHYAWPCQISWDSSFKSLFKKLSKWNSTGWLWLRRCTWPRWPWRGRVRWAAPGAAGWRSLRSPAVRTPPFDSPAVGRTFAVCHQVADYFFI